MKNEDTKTVISELLKEQKIKIDILKNIDPEAFSLNKMVRYVSDYKDDEIIPKKGIKPDSTPEEIFGLILEYEEKIKIFYTSILRVLNAEKQEELFKSLVTFKENHMASLRSIIEDYKITK